MRIMGAEKYAKKRTTENWAKPQPKPKKSLVIHIENQPSAEEIESFRFFLYIYSLYSSLPQIVYEKRKFKASHKIRFCGEKSIKHENEIMKTK